VAGVSTQTISRARAIVWDQLARYAAGQPLRVAQSALRGLLFLLVVAHPLRKTPADQIALSYGGGLLAGAKYQKTVFPGSGLVVNGMFDKWYEYPVTVRNYIVSLNPNEGDRGKADEITAPDAGAVPTRSAPWSYTLKKTA